LVRAVAAGFTLWKRAKGQERIEPSRCGGGGGTTEEDLRTQR
jgi:hypothetical protein